MISVITPTVRPDGLEIVRKCLKRQDFEDWEWIIVSPVPWAVCNETRDGFGMENYEFSKPTNGYFGDSYTSVWDDGRGSGDVLITQDPPKEKDDFWTLCKGWNKAYARARGELIVNIQDLIWFPPDTLSKFWTHYQLNSKRLVGALGHQYSNVDENGKPQNIMWTDPRWKSDISFEKVSPSEMEMTMCSIPKQALLDCGGIDEEYDKANGAQEKEMCFRLRELGYEMYLDHSIEYRAIHHERLTKDWDEVYLNKTTPLFVRHMQELEIGRRTLNVNNLLKYVER